MVFANGVKMDVDEEKLVNSHSVQNDLKPAGPVVPPYNQQLGISHFLQETEQTHFALWTKKMLHQNFHRHNEFWTVSQNILRSWTLYAWEYSSR